MVESMMERERNRLLAATLKHSDESLRWVSKLASKLDPMIIKKVATAYYQAC